MQCIVKVQAEIWSHETSLAPPFVFIEVHIPIPGKRAVMYWCLGSSILRLYVILIFYFELFRQCGTFGFSFHYIAWFVLSSMVCIFQHCMYCPAWYVLSSTVCIFQHGMYFPAWYVFSSMICIFQHDMHCPEWYVLSSMVCIFQHSMYFQAWYVLSTLFNMLFVYWYDRR